MNCKPGELAYIKRSGPHFGRVVRVLKLDPLSVRPSWLYDGATVYTEQGDRYVSLLDGILQPIRDPGDDAVDETLQWKPVPLPQIDPSLLEAA